MLQRPSRVATIGFATAALVGFAFNSLLCRLALRPHLIDAATFSAVRFASGALTLAILLRARGGGAPAGSWSGAAALFAYAVPFSLAYQQLDAGVGSLVLFGSVQAAMIGWGLVRGHRPVALEWAGLAISIAGLVALVLPSLSAPPLGSSLLMAAAGCAWGAYSLIGRQQGSPLGANAGNFLRATPGLLVFAGCYALAGLSHASTRGLLLAAASGTLASGLGYACWYAALPALLPTRAAVLQLSVPVIAALGGVALLGESVSLRLLICGAVILSGVGLALAGGRR